MKAIRNIIFFFLLLAGIACSEQGHEEQHAAGQNYTCPMHPQIVEPAPGTCPICFMDLVPVSKGGDNRGELVLSESQMVLANIQTMAVRAGTSTNNTILTGRLVLDETQNELISSRAAGRVERLYIKETGQAVRKGQPLYELYSEELLTLKREYLLALEQHRQLGAQQPRFASFLEAARKKLLLYGLTDAQINQLARSGNPEPRITFLSPASGVITDVAATEGQYVPEGGVLYRLADLSKIWVEAELYPQEAQAIRAGDPVQVAVQGFGTKPVAARVSFISPELRQGSQVVVMRAELPNPEGNYLPGMQANVLVPRQSSLISIPNDAVIRGQRGSHVWVHTGEGTFKARPVELGEANFDSVAIRSGLTQGENVVTSGAYLLYSEHVLKKGGEPTAGVLTEQAIDLAQTPTEEFIEEDAADYSQQIPASFKQQLDVVLQAYLSLKNALVAGNTEVSTQAAGSLATALTKTNDGLLKGEAGKFWLEKKAFLLQHLEQSRQLADIEAKRENFIYISQPIIKVVEAFGTPESLFVQYCPMANNDKGAYWLSGEQEIRNPYYGDAMLSCGEVVKEL
ncbi:efflux RND transporter periplasmic adaptor subunit [Cesiribacter sp. SM1]|uniref:efflux RND transporter periplasmic adaptor subunit n=1 Tax=Cesiribacter sp. SM1 TaxID=2861196 RepID=UPI001CD394DD|nr:efflux RND transporter periplasmic adaptor subunit [Cesiribacter sp. SM1]